MRMTLGVKGKRCWLGNNGTREWGAPNGLTVRGKNLERTDFLSYLPITKHPNSIPDIEICSSFLVFMHSLFPQFIVPIDKNNSKGFFFPN